MIGHSHRPNHEPIDTDECYRDFWAPLVEHNGVVDMELVKAELHDYHMLLSNVPIVYDHITGGRISKPNTSATDVIAEADSYESTRWDEAMAELDAT